LFGAQTSLFYKSERFGLAFNSYECRLGAICVSDALKMFGLEDECP